MNKITYGITALNFIVYEVELDPVHPLKFLATVFANPVLKNYVPDIFKHSFLKERFMGGVIKGMEREAPRKNIEPYLADFAREVGASAEALRPFIRAKDWEGLVVHLTK